VYPLEEGKIVSRFIFCYYSRSLLHYFASDETCITDWFQVINGAGWHDWNGDTDLANVYYAEYANTGSGASGTRVSWSKKLTSAVSPTTVLGSGYTSGGWYDASYPN
jgi:hypothetical protein